MSFELAAYDCIPNVFAYRSVFDRTSDNNLRHAVGIMVGRELVDAHRDVFFGELSPIVTNFQQVST